LARFHIQDLFPHLSHKKIVVWGTGSSYSNWAYKVDISHSYFVDGNPEKWHTVLDGKNVFPPSYILADSDEPVVLILSIFTEEIIEKLNLVGVAANRIITLVDLQKAMARRERVKQFENHNYIIRELFEEFLQAFDHVKYREVSLSSVLSFEYGILLTYLFVPEIDILLHTKRMEIEYRIHGSTKLVVSNVFGRRSDHNALIDAYFSDMLKEEVGRIEYIDHKNQYDRQEYQSFFFKYDKSTAISDMFERLEVDIYAIMSQLRFSMNEMEKEWFVEIVSYYVKYIDFLYAMFDQLDIESYCCFVDHYGEQSAAVQILKNMGVKTVFLQHGLIPYFTEKDNKVFPVLYTHYNHIADVFLAWGETQKEYLYRLGVNKSKIVVLGNPKYNFTTATIEHIVQSRRRLLKFRHFVLFLPAAVFNNHTMITKLIETAEAIAKQRGLTYMIKLHPALKWDVYADIPLPNCTKVIQNEMTLLEIFEEVDFGISTISTVMVEAQVYRAPIFIYETELVSDITGVKYVEGFKTIEELLEKLDIYQDDSQFMNLMRQMGEISNGYIEITDKKASTRYGNYFSSLR